MHRPPDRTPEAAGPSASPLRRANRRLRGAARTWVAATALAGVLGACAVGTGSTPVLLTLPMPPEAATAATNTGVGAGVLSTPRVLLPEYVVVRRVRYRAQRSTLAEWPNTFWGERIEVGVARAFDAGLRRELPDWALCDTRCGEREPVWSVRVEFETLDYVRDLRRLQAQVQVSLNRGGAPRAAQEFSYELACAEDSPQGQAQAIADLTARVAHDVGALLRGAQP